MREVLRGELKSGKRPENIPKSKKDNSNSGLELIMIKVKRKVKNVVNI